MRRLLIPVLFVVLVATAFTLSTTLSSSAEASGAPTHSGSECPFKSV